MKAGLPANPRQMAHTMLDFPVPLAPIIIFKWGPGDTSQTSYVLNYKEVRLLSSDKGKARKSALVGKYSSLLIST